ncbi:calcium/proton exchanger Cax [Pleurocapsa sp. PCC 7327]|uniref:calcium/proton exchanger n=1 Tax=Pleurocapsa sp. PCC 7327 TaxID=118163 RepID=UPI00029FBF70|nr:calcium/proton exchanger [Pleurocapsa sp. PCC 7327]AFY75791.1 calcium/proton exchanger Cax [Pleurocapsa sp. PCC 7327]
MPQFLSLPLLKLLLLVFIPLSIAAKWLDWGTLAVFLTSALAIVPLSLWLGTATEKVAIVTGPSVGGLVNAIFGNATVLIITLIALREGLVDLVKASITGSILSDLLLFLGAGMLAGGLRYKELEFQPILARVNGSSMTLAACAIALPTMVIYTSNVVDAIAITNLSIIVATVLAIVYGLTLLFSLKTHSYLYDVGLADEENSDLSDTDKAKMPSLKVWLSVLLVSTVAVAYESELFVEVVESAIQGLGLTPLFTGVILLPLISDVSGVVTVVRLALKNKMDLTVSVAMGDSLLISLFVAPCLVLVGQLMGQDMDLNFNPFEVVALAVAVTVSNLISFSGRSNWLNGILLLATYIILGVAFYYHPA